MLSPVPTDSGLSPAMSQARKRTLVPSNWRIYAAAAGSSLAMAASAQADTIVSSTPNITLLSHGGATGLSQPFGIAPGTNRFRAYLAFLTYNQRFYTNARFFATGAKFANGRSATGLVKYLPGAPITLGATNVTLTLGQGVVRFSNNGTAPSARFGRRQGNFPNDVSSGIVAFKFTSGPQSGDIGWIQIKLTETPGSSPTSQFQVLSAAYNATPGAPIVAGQSSSSSEVPEPSTLGLALLALGAAGMANWRKLRKETAVSAE